MSKAPSTRGQFVASLADRVVAARAEQRPGQSALVDLRRMCEESGIEVEVLLAEARRRARRRDVLIDEHAGLDDRS